MPKSRKSSATFSLEQLALGLVMAEPKHGYQLYEDYQASFGPIWQVGRSRFYAALNSLRERGYLSVETEMQADRPPRKIYAITEAGTTYFSDWLHRPVTPMRAVRVEFVAKLRFFDLLHLPGVERLLDDQLAVCRKTEQMWTAQMAAMSARGEDPFMKLVYDFRLRQARFIVDWLDTCRTALGERTPA